MHVVVLAYGPANATKRAVRRAREIAAKGKEVIVVPATAVAQPAVAELHNVATVADSGRLGLHEALLELPEEPVLLFHDDVVITRRSAAAMERSLRCGNRYVVPYGNDRDLGSFFKTLPVDHAAERKLDKIAAPTETKELVATRVSCLLASKSDFVGLLTEPIVDPFFTVVTHDHNFFAAAGAIAAHSGKCTRRTTAVDPEGRPLLVAAVIVKNEEKMLPGCLESLAPVVDRIEVCDTGSTDSTVSIARAAGANVIHRDWPDDFAVARNYALDQCRDARYIVVLDADERLICDDPDQVRRYLATYSAEHPGLTVGVANLDEDGVERNRFRSVRIFHADGTEYRGAIHETIHAVDAADPLAGTFFSRLSVEHHGYTDEVVSSKDKVRRNLSIAEAAYAAEPTAMTALHLARSLSYAGQDPARARDLLEEAWAGSTDATTTAKAQILALLADQYLTLGEVEKAFDLSRDALLLVPADDSAAALLAVSAHRLGRNEDLIEIAESLEGKTSDPPAHHVEENRSIYRNGLINAYALTGNSEQAVARAFELLTDHPHDLDVWEVLVECLQSGFGNAALELLLPLAVKDRSGGFVEPVVRSFPTALVATFAAAYLASGGEIPEVTRVGLLAAAMSGDEETFGQILPHAARLEPGIRVALAGKIASNGRGELAELLQDMPVGVAV